MDALLINWIFICGKSGIVSLVNRPTGDRNEQCLSQAGRASPPRTISVVIPALNEAAALPDTLERIRPIPQIIEVIVVDGGSTDATCQIAKNAGCNVLNSSPGRGRQLRLGSLEAAGDVVLMLHADTWLLPNAGHALLEAMRDPSVVGGGFWKVFREPAPLMMISRPACLLRLLLARRVMGDQGLFVRRDVLNQIGGVPDVPLMEEFELCKKLRAAGRLALADATVSTSARRFRARGVLKTYFRMWQVTILYHLGTSPEKLRELYERK